MIFHFKVSFVFLVLVLCSEVEVVSICRTENIQINKEICLIVLPDGREIQLRRTSKFTAELDFLDVSPPMKMLDIEVDFRLKVPSTDCTSLIITQYKKKGHMVCSEQRIIENTPSPPPVRPKPASPASPQCGSIAISAVPMVVLGDTYTHGDWPWLVAIYCTAHGKVTYICCGTLISDRHVITAAHCMILGHGLVNLTTRDIMVRVGAFNLDTWGDDVQRSLSDAKVHDDYNSTTLANDILLMTFSKPVEFNDYIRPICLWSFDTSLDNVANNIGVVTGWGKDENGLTGRGLPKFMRIPIVTNTTCRASNSDFHKFTNNGNTFCAGHRNGSGPCNGDSGGGLYLMRDRRWYIRGLVSLALLPENGIKDHCNLDEYLVFTDVAKFVPWIMELTRR